MEVRRIADSLLRSRPSPILSFLVPSVSSKRSSAVTLPCSSYASFGVAPRGTRHLTTKPPHHQPSSAPAVAEPEDNDPPYQPSTPPSPSSTSSPSPNFDAINPPLPPSKAEQIGNILDSTLAGHNYSNITRNSKFKSNAAQTAQQSTTSSSDLVRSQFSLAMSKSKSPYADHQGSIFAGMDTPSPAGHVSNYDKSRAIQDAITSFNPRNERTIRLSPSIGRTVDIDPASGMDLARGLRMLDIKCAVNKVRQDFTEQRFHERAGLKRKRLKSVRWRRKFKDGFQAVVSKVQDMRRRGW